MLNEKTIKNKNIHHCYKCKEKQWFDLQNIVLKATAAVLNIANLCFIGYGGTVNHQMILERK